MSIWVRNLVQNWTPGIEVDFPRGLFAGSGVPVSLQGTEYRKGLNTYLCPNRMFALCLILPWNNFTSCCPMVCPPPPPRLRVVYAMLNIFSVGFKSFVTVCVENLACKPLEIWNLEMFDFESYPPHPNHPQKRSPTPPPKSVNWPLSRLWPSLPTTNRKPLKWTHVNQNQVKFRSYLGDLANCTEWRPGASFCIQATPR